MDKMNHLRQQMAYEAVERGELALQLEADGKTWQQIGHQFGVSRQRAGQILDAARRRRSKAKRKRT